MKGCGEIVDMMRQNGFVTREEAAQMIGRADGGNIPKLMARHNVRCVQVGTQENGLVRLMYKKDDVEALKKDDIDNAVGGNSNGGRIMNSIYQLRQEVAALSLNHNAIMNQLSVLENIDEKLDDRLRALEEFKRKLE